MRARLAQGGRGGRRGTTSATLSTAVMMMAAEKVDEAAEEVAAEARCADVAVEEKEVVVVVAVEVERVVAGAERGTMTGSPGTTELESRLKTREEAAARVTGELLRTMCPRRVRKQTPLSTLRARRSRQRRDARSWPW